MKKSQTKQANKKKVPEIQEKHSRQCLSQPTLTVFKDFQDVLQYNIALEVYLPKWMNIFEAWYRASAGWKFIWLN